jgi:hypothetical protein
LQPVCVTGEWLRRPVAPCELLPQGFPGVLLVNARPYLCSCVGELPEQGEPVVRGYQLVKDDGTVYHIDLHARWGGWDCDCPDSTFRPDRPGSCKHVAALRQACATAAPPSVSAARLLAHLAPPSPRPQGDFPCSA